MKRFLLLMSIVLLGVTPMYAQSRKSGRKSHAKYTSEQCIEAFVERMNTNAKIFGMTNTCFKNASGRDAEGHYSTASDILRLLIAATTYDKLMLYWGFEEFDINVTGEHARTITVKNTYKGKEAASLGDYYDIFGGKSGSWYSKNGGRHVASAVKSKVDDRWLVGCVMNTGKDRFIAMRQLMDWLEAKRVDPNTPDAELDCMYAAATVLPLHSGMAYLGRDLVMVSKDPDGIKAPYSMTKMMTAIIALDYCKPDEVIVVQENDLQRGSGPKFYDGDRLTMEEALIALMLPSSNTIAKAISRHVGEKILHLRNEPRGRKR